MIDTIKIVAGQGMTIGQDPLKEVEPHEVEIKNCRGYISAGTELMGIVQHRNQAKGSAPSFPLGYSQSGIVTRVGKDVRAVSPGDRVVAIGAGAYHAHTIVVAQNLVVPLPESVDFEVASMMAMYCFALQGVYQVNPRIGQNVVIFGAGMMGQLSARLYQLMGCRVYVVDSNDYRLGFLPEGVTGLVDGDAGWQTLRKETQPYGVEVAAFCFGGDATKTIDRLKPLMSHSPEGIPHGALVFPGGATVTVTMATNMGNMRLISSAKAGPGYRDPAYEAGHDYPLTYVPNTVRRNMETLLGLIADGRLVGLEQLITHRFPFSEAPKAYGMLETPGVAAMAVLLTY